MKWYLMVIKQYANFDGRARRKEYWMFILFNLIASYALFGLDYLFGTQVIPGLGILSSLYSLAVIIPSLAVSVRRLHDLGKSGWMYLIIFIPIIGAIWLIVLDATVGNVGDNKYGADPISVAAGTSSDIDN